MGNIQVTPSEKEGVDYVVFLKSLFDLSYSTNNKDDRLGTLKTIMSRHCESYEIVKETPIDRGKNFVGRQMIDYYYDVRCA